MRRLLARAIRWHLVTKWGENGYIYGRFDQALYRLSRRLDPSVYWR